IKKMKVAEEKLNELSDRQELLHKKLKEAERIADAVGREQELKRLAHEQGELQNAAQELVRELSRLRAERASEALGQAAGRMQQDGVKTETPEERQQETLERLNEARQELARARQESEAELGREKTAKLADQIKGVRQRQESLKAEAGRVHQEA